MENLDRDIIVKVTGQNGNELEMKVSWQDDIYAWRDHFRSILYWLTFHPNNIDEVLPDPDMVDKADDEEC